MKTGQYASNQYNTILDVKNGELIYVRCSSQTKETIEKKMINLLAKHSFIYLYIFNLDYIINKEFESTGINKLIRLFDCFVSASNGGIVFVDEMDSNLNDVYLCKLIEYFMYYGKGQLCFTTHNPDPMGILKKNRNSIDFLSSDNHLVSWTSRGNATPENCYRNGMIEDSPFNIEASDFVGILSYISDQQSN